MGIKFIALIQRESTVDPRMLSQRSFFASFRLFRENGQECGVARYLTGGFREVGDLLKGVAGVPNEQLQDSFLGYEMGEEVRITFTVDNEEIVSKLGFNSKAA